MKVKNLMVGLIFALVLGFTHTIFGQGCSGDVWEYSSSANQTYIYKNIGGKLVLVQIDRANTSENRMAIRFKTQSVRVEKGKNIQFEVETDTAVTGAWYAIYHKATEDFTKPINANNYLLPLAPNELSGENGQVNAQRIPPSRYYLDDRLIDTSPDTEILTTPIPSYYAKLSNLQLNTANLAPGLYWFTLQTDAVYNGQTPNQCAKTTPPVLIEITPPPTPTPKFNIPPTIEPESNIVDCDFPTIKATAKDEDNKPNSGKTPQTLSIIWNITDSKGNKYNYKVINSGNPNSEEYFEQIEIEGLLPEVFYIKVKAFDGKDYSQEKTTTLDVKCKIAKRIYFQFAIPYESLRGGVFKLSDYLIPDSWTNNRRGTRCSPAYPNYEYPLSNNEVFALTNKDKLDEIVQILKSNKDYRLEILGFADKEKSKGYDNTALGWRRVKVVRQYLVNELRKTGNDTNVFTGDVVENSLGDTTAESNDDDPCEERRRHDRRVDLIYYVGSERPKISIYKYKDKLNLKTKTNF